jgi:hypothetical protein
MAGIFGGGKKKKKKSSTSTRSSYAAQPVNASPVPKSAGDRSGVIQFGNVHTGRKKKYGGAIKGLKGGPNYC